MGNAVSAKPDFMHFHAHVYYFPETRASAYVMRERLIEASRLPVGGLAGLEVGPLEDSLRGPHAAPMFELEFGVGQFAEVVLWLLFHRGSHRVLVHAVTGHDPRDHASHSFWLGESLPLDFARLDPPTDAPAPRFEPGLAPSH
jgi:DOPA 4,5-dioxygenase